MAFKADRAKTKCHFQSLVSVLNLPKASITFSSEGFARFPPPPPAPSRWETADAELMVPSVAGTDDPKLSVSL